MENEKSDTLFARGFTHNLFGLIGRSSRPLYLICFARLLGAEGFGIYLLGFSIIETVSKFTMLGVNGGMIRIVGKLEAEDKHQDIFSVVSALLAFCALISLLCASLLWVLANPIAVEFFRKPFLTDIIQRFSMCLPGLVVSFVALGAIRATLEMKYEVIIQSYFEPAAIFTLGGLGLLWAPEIKTLIWVHCIVYSLSAFATIIFIFRRFGGESFRWQAIRNFDWSFATKESLKVGSIYSVSVLKQHMDMFVLARYVSPFYLGLYAAVVELASAIRKVRSSIDPMVMPMFQKIYAKKDLHFHLESFIRSVVTWFLVPALFVAGLFLIAGDWFLSLFDPRFASYAFILYIAVLGQLFYGALGMLENILFVTGSSRKSVYYTFYLAILNLIFLFILVPRYGAAGAATATTLSFFWVGLLNIRELRRNLGAWAFGRNHFALGLFFSAAAATSFFILYQGQNSIAALLWFACLFGSTVYVLHRNRRIFSMPSLPLSG